MLKIYMLASGAIAVPVLNELLNLAGQQRIELLGAGTQPDRPAGRKQQLMPTPVGVFAAERGLAIDKFPSLNDGAAELRLKALSPDFLVVVSYGQLLKRPLLELPRLGCVNVHASLLPRYRGASPIAHAIANRDAMTGISFMDMEIGLDTGKVFQAYNLVLDGTEYADALEITLGKLAAAHLFEVLDGIAAGRLPGVAQDPALVTVTRKIKKSDGVIDWQRSATEIEAAVRAYTPWPGAGFVLDSGKGPQRMTLARARIVPNLAGGAPGEIVQADRHGWVVACGTDALEFVEVVPPGKKAMSGANFLNGCREKLVGRRLIAG